MKLFISRRQPIYIIFLSLALICLALSSRAQGLTKYGESTSGPSTNFVDKNGKTGSSPVLNKYGQAIPSCAGGAQTSGCGGLTAMTDARVGGQVYNIVQIGTQCWMAQNLNWGTQVPAATGQGTPNTKYCYQDDAANCTIYGGLYEWAAMMNGAAPCNGDAACPPCAANVQGLCPAGWHIPSHNEWTLLEKNAGSSPGAFHYDEFTGGWFGTDEGSNLKETGTTHWIPANTGAANTTGFTALPGGISWAGSFYYGGYDGYWWSATENGGVPWDRTLHNNYVQAGRGTTNGAGGLSVRCVKD